MRKPLWIVATVFVLLLACMGQLKVSQYPNTKTAADTDLLLLATPGVTNWNIKIADFKTNVVAQGGGNTYYINNSYITNLRVLMFTSSIAYITGDLYVSNIYSGTIYVTNFYVTNIYASNVYVSNLVAAGITSENTYFDFNYTTNLYVSETNINNVTITTNLTVYETNINNVTINTNLYVTQNSYISNLYTTNLFTTNLYATNIYVTNLYVDNPMMGLQQLTNVALTNVANGEVLKWDDTMKKWTNTTISTTFVITNPGVLVTNIAYTTNQGMDFSFMYNDYYMTNAMANNINVCPTNLPDGSSFSLSLQGASSYTNFDVYFTWPASASVIWLAVTNGFPVTTITSNKVQFYSFLVRYSSTKTNVIASFKEQP